jgi:hypothetical protein
LSGTVARDRAASALWNERPVEARRPERESSPLAATTAGERPDEAGFARAIWADERATTTLGLDVERDVAARIR